MLKLFNVLWILLGECEIRRHFIVIILDFLVLKVVSELSLLFFKGGLNFLLVTFDWIENLSQLVSSLHVESILKPIDFWLSLDVNDFCQGVREAGSNIIACILFQNFLRLFNFLFRIMDLRPVISLMIVTLNRNFLIVIFIHLIQFWAFKPTLGAFQLRVHKLWNLFD